MMSLLGRCHCAQCDGALICALVAHHADTLHRQKYRAGLPHLVIEPPVAQTLDEYIVGILEYAHLLGGNVAEYAHC